MTLYGYAGDVEGVERAWTDLVALRWEQHVESGGGGGGGRGEAELTHASVERAVVDLPAHADRVKALARAASINRAASVRALLSAVDTMEARAGVELERRAAATDCGGGASLSRNTAWDGFATGVKEPAWARHVGSAFAAAIRCSVRQSEDDACSLGLRLWSRATLGLGIAPSTALLNAVLGCLTRASPLASELAHR